MLNFLGKIFKSTNQRRIDSYEKNLSKKINLREEEIAKLSEEEFKKINVGTEDALVEVFASVREASKRTIGLRHYDCQLIGGLVLNGGNITEMKTGEGKTLVATLPAVFNALSGKKVYVVTVNDYLAERDANWMKTYLMNIFGLMFLKPRQTLKIIIMLLMIRATFLMILDLLPLEQPIHTV